MKRFLFGFVAALAIAGCDSQQKDVADAQKDLNETRQEAAKDVKEAQVGAIQDVNETKEDAAKDVKEAQKDLADERADLKESTSSTTASGGILNNGKEVSVSPEQCARFAKTKEVKPEDKAMYEACSKLDKKAYK